MPLIAKKNPPKPEGLVGNDAAYSAAIVIRVAKAAKAAKIDAGNSVTFTKITAAHNAKQPNLILLNVDT